MKGGASRRYWLWENIDEQAVKSEQVYYSYHEWLRYKSGYLSIFIMWQYLIVQYTVEIEEHNEYNLHIRTELALGIKDVSIRTIES